MPGNTLPAAKGVGKTAPLHDLAASDDLVRLVQSHANAAERGDAAAQLLIARALMICVDVLGTPVSAFEGTSMPINIVARYERDSARCRRKLRTDDPFKDLPKRNGGYPMEYWLQRAAESGEPLAVALKASRDILSLVQQPSGLEQKAKIRTVEAGLRGAVRRNDPEINYYIGRTLLMADNKGESPSDVRGVGWILASCRAGVCDRIPEPLSYENCPPGMGRSCDQNSAIQYALQTELGPEKYARAVAQSYEIEDLLQKGRWDDLDLALDVSDPSAQRQ